MADTFTREGSLGLTDGDMYVYAYETGERPDGYRYAVGVCEIGNGPAKPMALFQRIEDLLDFLRVVATRPRAVVDIMPSVERDMVARNLTL